MNKNKTKQKKKEREKKKILAKVRFEGGLTIFF